MQLPAARVRVGAPQRLGRPVVEVVVGQVQAQEEGRDAGHGKQKVLFAGLAGVTSERNKTTARKHKGRKRRIRKKLPRKAVVNL